MAYRDSAMEECPSRRSPVSSVENAGSWKKRKREYTTDDDSHYREAFQNLRKIVETALFDDKAKIAHGTKAFILDHFSMAENLFFDAYLDNVSLRAQVNVLERLSSKAKATQAVERSLPPLSYREILTTKDPKALLEPYCTPVLGKSPVELIMRSTSPFKAAKPPSQRTR